MAMYEQPRLSPAAAVAIADYQAHMDLDPDSIAILDGETRIVAVNAAWRCFADANDARLVNYGIGVCYLYLLDDRTLKKCPTFKADDADIAATVARGLVEVLAGHIPIFVRDYPCDSPVEKRWFRVEITPLLWPGFVGAQICHAHIPGPGQPAYRHP